MGADEIAGKSAARQADYPHVASHRNGSGWFANRVSLAFNRRIRETFTDPSGQSFEAWVAQPTDIIIGKLHAWEEGRSDKHPNDIFSILFFCLRGYSSHDVNLDEVTKEAAHLGQETLEMWNKTLARAKGEIEKGYTPRKW